MSPVSVAQLAQFQRAGGALLGDSCTLYRPGAGLNSYGDAVTVPVVRARAVPCALGVRPAAPTPDAGGTVSTSFVPVLRLPPAQAVALGDWAALSGGAWYRVVGAPPVPTHALTQTVEVEPTARPGGV